MRYLAALYLGAAPAFCACVGFGGAPAGSACKAELSGLRWEKPASAEIVEIPGAFYDSSLSDSAFGRGIVARQDAQLEFRAKGKHLVEVFLAVTDDGSRSFTLEAGGKVVDSRYVVRPGPVRLMPSRRLRQISLLALVAGPARLEIRTDAPQWTLVALRWTANEEFERDLVPRWQSRARHLASTALFEADGDRPEMRRHYLQQLYDRLHLSHSAEVRKEATIGLARVWYWLAVENHQPADIERTAELFRDALRIAPHEPLVHQMISASCTGSNVGQQRSVAHGTFCYEVEPVPWAVSRPFTPREAPAWAAAQRRLVRRMDAITRWWVENRQHESGELGGGWGDDVEILRSWGPQALGLGSEVAARGIVRIADGLWKSGLLAHGYDKHISDVEHSSEPTTDTLPLLAALDPDSGTVRERLKETSACAFNWVQPQQDGRYRFGSSWFNCRDFDPSPQRAVDVHLNVRAMGPFLWNTYLARDSAAIALLAKWGESWLEAMRRTDHGKPAGIIPSVVRSADGSYLINSKEWDKPNAEWDYFQWSGRSQQALTSLFLALHDLTGEERWLRGTADSFQVLADCTSHGALCDEMRREPAAYYEWRRRSADARLDRAVGYHCCENDDTKLSLMARLAEESEQRLASNFDMFTSEVLYTDRVYYLLQPAYQELIFGGEAPRGERYPGFAVTWPVSKVEFARAVLEATPDSLRLRIHSFENRQLPVSLRAWRLKPGDYRWEVKNTAGKLIHSGVTAITKLPVLLDLPAPGGREVTVRIYRLAT